VLEQLTVVGSVEEAAFVERFHRLKATGCSYIVVVEDKQRRVVVATAALYLEPKFLRSCGTVSRDIRNHVLGVPTLMWFVALT